MDWLAEYRLRQREPDNIAREYLADGDCDIFPSEQDELLAKSAAAAESLRSLPWADHYLHPVGAEGAKLADPRDRIIDLIVPWIEERIGEP